MSREQGPRSAGMGASGNASSHRHAVLDKPLHVMEVGL